MGSVSPAATRTRTLALTLTHTRTRTLTLALALTRGSEPRHALPVFQPLAATARGKTDDGTTMARSEGLLACVVLLLSVPTVATLQLPRAAGPGLRPGPHASRAQRQQLSRGDVLRGALAVAATWASPHADSVRPVRTGCDRTRTAPASCAP